jgi:ribosomal protein S18 acetylase RimI-like enzyme
MLDAMTSDCWEMPPGARLTIETEAKPEDIRYLEECLYEFNVQATGIPDGCLLGLSMRAADGSLMGRAHGWTWGGTCHIRYLFVPADMRERGHGTVLMRAAEKEAKSRGCGQIVLETHDFQALEFYRRLGFEVVGHVADYPRGHQYLMLVKRLT